MEITIQIFKLLGSIALLIYGMKVMSEALQKMAGPQLRHMLGAMYLPAPWLQWRSSRRRPPPS